MFDESKHRFPMDVISREKLNLQVIVTTIRKLKNVSECNFLHGMMKVLTKSRRGALARIDETSRQNATRGGRVQDDSASFGLGRVRGSP